MLHRNSFKRLYNQDSVYFITAVTYRRFPYFQEEIFCRLFLDNLIICKQIKGFKLYGFVIIPNHTHLLIKPGGKDNISEIMHYFKRATAFQVNWLMGLNPETVGEDLDPRLPGYREQFREKYGSPQYQIPKFCWQQSFYDHRIRNEKEFYGYLEYIASNPAKHGLTDDETEYPWLSVNSKFAGLID